MKEKQKPLQNTEEAVENLEKLKKAAEPLHELLATSYDPMCSIVVDLGGVTVVRREAGTPFRIDDL